MDFNNITIEECIDLYSNGVVTVINDGEVKGFEKITYNSKRFTYFSFSKSAINKRR